MSETVIMRNGSEFEPGMEVADKVRDVGLGDTPMPQKTYVQCSCGEKYEKKVLIDECPHCHMTYAISHASADDPQNVLAAGIDY